MRNLQRALKTRAAQVFNPAERRRAAEWRQRIYRDKSAMRNIISHELTAQDCAVDVGAHAGEITAWLVDAAPQGHHTAIEPLPDLAHKLRDRFPQVTVHQCALSDSEGEATFFHVVDAPAWSGFHQQSPMAGKRTQQITVDIRRLDDVVGDANIALVKIDVEGAELGVLRGGEKVLDRDRPIVLFEHARVHSEPYGTSPDDVWAFLDARAYTVAPLANPDPLDRHEFRSLCETSHASGYDRNAVTNWIAKPRS